MYHLQWYHYFRAEEEILNQTRSFNRMDCLNWRIETKLPMRIFLTSVFLCCTFFVNAQILSPREQAVVIDEILADRVNNLLPQLMEKAGIDMWVIISREYNEDPIIKTFLPATWLSARRRTHCVLQ
jgi:hypothetical protein